MARQEQLTWQVQKRTINMAGANDRSLIKNRARKRLFTTTPLTLRFGVVLTANISKFDSILLLPHHQVVLSLVFDSLLVSQQVERVAGRDCELRRVY